MKQDDTTLTNNFTAANKSVYESACRRKKFSNFAFF